LIIIVIFAKKIKAEITFLSDEKYFKEKPVLFVPIFDFFTGFYLFVTNLFKIRHILFY